MNAEVVSIKDIDDLANEWRALEARANGSFFISWGWIGPWAAMALAANVELFLYRCIKDGETIALGILSRTRVTRHRVFRRTVLALNEVPASRLDMIIEYNDLLIHPDHGDSVRARFASDLVNRKLRWDELQLSGIPESSWNTIAAHAAKLKPIIDKQQHPWATDIREVNGDLEKLLAPLSRNRRWQTRRSIKAFQEDGELRTETPASLDEALAYFDDMGKLHTARWNSVGKTGSFANPNWVAFHQAVIRKGFSRNEIQLLKITAGDKAIGYVYSFIWRGTAYMLQTGFIQEASNTKRPGYVSHCLAMQHNSLSKQHTYDYMCGDSEYKRSLASPQNPLAWGILRKKTLKLCIEQSLAEITRSALVSIPRILRTNKY